MTIEDEYMSRLVTDEQFAKIRQRLYNARMKIVSSSYGTDGYSVSYISLVGDPDQIFTEIGDGKSVHAVFAKPFELHVDSVKKAMGMG